MLATENYLLLIPNRFRELRMFWIGRVLSNNVIQCKLHFRFCESLFFAIWIATVVKVKGQNRRPRRRGGRLLPGKRASCSPTFAYISVQRRIDKRRYIEYIDTFFTTLVLTKHGLLKKMKGVRRNIISPNGGDRSYEDDEVGHQAEYGQLSNGHARKNKKFTVVLCRGDYC
jgi:hypothetical protein